MDVILSLGDCTGFAFCIPGFRETVGAADMPADLAADTCPDKCNLACGVR